jgi:DMSO/TMAO reductase YedYZ molybdopterin-dependent catalytic subunit
VIFGVFFSVLFVFHFFFSVYYVRYNWRKTFQKLLKREADELTWLRLIQRLSGWFLIASTFLVLISGFDWFKLGSGRIIPFSFHVRFDILLSVSTILHSSIGFKMALMRRRTRIKDRELVNTASIARRETLKVVAGFVLSFIAAAYLDRISIIGKVAEKIVEKLPPGQYEVEKLKILHVGTIPAFDESEWTLEISGLVKNHLTLNYRELRELPSDTRISDFHCVTGWTKFHNKWEGVVFKEIINLIQPLENARFVTLTCENDYSTSLPITDLKKDDVILAYRLDDRELPPEYGGPLRVVVPHKYAYKSAKWIRKIKFTEKQEIGYWEARGYSNTADPFSNDRYWV